MATAFYTWDSTVRDIAADIKERILKSSDWVHLQLTTGTAATTLSAATAVNDVSISVAATIPSGSMIVIGNGVANPEVRVTTGVSGAGPFTVTFGKPLAAVHASGGSVAVGSYVKATTTRGAQMVLDLNANNESVVAANGRVTIDTFVSHDGTTAGASKRMYLIHSSATATVAVHGLVSAGKEHIVIQVQGPYWNETGTIDVNNGNAKAYYTLQDLVPYHAADTTPAVVLMGGTVANTQSNDVLAYVSKNIAASLNWVGAWMATLASPWIYNLPQVAAGDGKEYVWPIVVFEQIDGLRGRMAKMFFSGTTLVQRTGDSPAMLGQDLTYSGEGYRLVTLTRGSSSGGGSDVNTPINISPGQTPGQSIAGKGPIVAIPNGL